MLFSMCYRIAPVGKHLYITLQIFSFIILLFLKLKVRGNESEQTNIYKYSHDGDYRSVRRNME